jgi:hypothetical protein
MPILVNGDFAEYSRFIGGLLVLGSSYLGVTGKIGVSTLDTTVGDTGLGTGGRGSILPPQHPEPILRGVI